MAAQPAGVPSGSVPGREQVAGIGGGEAVVKAKATRAGEDAAGDAALWHRQVACVRGFDAGSTRIGLSSESAGKGKAMGVIADQLSADAAASVLENPLNQLKQLTFLLKCRVGVWMRAQLPRTTLPRNGLERADQFVSFRFIGAKVHIDLTPPARLFITTLVCGPDLHRPRP